MFLFSGRHPYGCPAARVMSAALFLPKFDIEVPAPGTFPLPSLVFHFEWFAEPMACTLSIIWRRLQTTLDKTGAPVHDRRAVAR